MRTAFVALLLVHGLIHLLGFVKAFRLAELKDFTQSVSRPVGLLWLLAAVSFMVMAGLFLAKNPLWMLIGLVAIVLSQLLVFFFWTDAGFGTLANVAILLALIVGYGNWNFQRQYVQDIQLHLGLPLSGDAMPLTEADLAPLPGRVQQYIRRSGAMGKPKIHNFRIAFDGYFRQSEKSSWMPFTCTQYDFIEKPARLFFMKGNMMLMPVAGYHRYVNAQASMDIRLLSLVPVQFQDGKEMNQSETVTFFNDMCCMAPATLIDPRIHWLEEDSNRVQATFTNQGITITAWLVFDENGALVDFTSNDRYAVRGKKGNTLTPWSTPLKSYKSLKGYLLPSYAETIYHFPEGDFTYGKFSVVDVEYNCTRMRRE